MVLRLNRGQVSSNFDNDAIIIIIHTAILKGKHIILCILLGSENPKQRKLKFDWLNLLGFRGHHICLPSSMSVFYLWSFVAEDMFSKEGHFFPFIMIYNAKSVDLWISKPFNSLGRSSPSTNGICTLVTNIVSIYTGPVWLF